MRDALLSLTLALLFCLSLQCYRLPRSHFQGAFYAYVVCQFFFTGICLLAARKIGWTSLVYFRCFYGSMLAVSIAAVALAFQFGRALPTMRHFAGSAWVIGLFSLWIGYTFLESLKLKNMLTVFSVLHVGSACLFLCCGAFGLLSLAFPTDIISDVIRFAISFMWVLVGVEGLFEAGFYLRARADAVSRIALAPTVVSLVILAALTAFLFFNQAELSRQPANGTVVMEAHR